MDSCDELEITKEYEFDLGDYIFDDDNDDNNDDNNDVIAVREQNFELPKKEEGDEKDEE